MGLDKRNKQYFNRLEANNPRSVNFQRQLLKYLVKSIIILVYFIYLKVVAKVDQGGRDPWGLVYLMALFSRSFFWEWVNAFSLFKIQINVWIFFSQNLHRCSKAKLNE